MNRRAIVSEKMVRNKTVEFRKRESFSTSVIFFQPEARGILCERYY